MNELQISIVLKLCHQKPLDKAAKTLSGSNLEKSVVHNIMQQDNSYDMLVNKMRCQILSIPVL